MLLPTGEHENTGSRIGGKRALLKDLAVGREVVVTVRGDLAGGIERDEKRRLTTVRHRLFDQRCKAGMFVERDWVTAVGSLLPETA